jgi:AcrR family transcriptional regulator
MKVNAVNEVVLQPCQTDPRRATMPAAIDEQIIFNAALKTITERGYIGATTKLIAEEAGIGEVTLFRRFGNEDNLILEALKHEASTLDTAVSLYTGKLEADLNQVVSAYQALLRARAPLMLAVYTEVARQPELATIFEYPKRIIQKMLEMLMRYQTEGKLTRKEPMQQLAELFGPVMMLMLFETVFMDESNFDTKAHIKGFLKSNRP